MTFCYILVVGVFLNWIYSVLIIRQELSEGKDFTLSDLTAGFLMCMLPFLIVLFIVMSRFSDPVILKGKRKE